MSIRPLRAWINAPSEHQALHKYHGRNVLAIIDSFQVDAIATAYFTEGDVISLRVPMKFLSNGWIVRKPDYAERTNVGSDGLSDQDRAAMDQQLEEFATKDYQQSVKIEEQDGSATFLSVLARREFEYIDGMASALDYQPSALFWKALGIIRHDRVLNGFYTKPRKNLAAAMMDIIYNKVFRY